METGTTGSRKIFFAAYPILLACFTALAAILPFMWMRIAFAVLLSLSLAVVPFAARGRCIITTLIFSYIIFHTASRLPLPLGWVVFAVLVFSVLADTAYLIAAPSFRRQFPKRGLLFWGIAFLGCVFALGGILSADVSLAYIPTGAAIGLALMAVYHGGMALGEGIPIAHIASVSALCMGVSATAICIVSHGVPYSLMLVCVFPCIHLALKKEWGFIPHVAGVCFIFFGAAEIYFDGGMAHILPSLSELMEHPLIGQGLDPARQGAMSPLGALLLSVGALGLLALLTHMKHLLEIAIRAFSLCCLALVLTCLTVLLLPASGGVYFVWAALFYMIFALSAESELEARRREMIDNIRPRREGRLPRVVFVFVEAGKGHISPTRAVCDAFKERYGHRAEVVESYFYSEGENADLESIERLFASAVRIQNKNRILSILCRVGNFLAGDAFAQYVLMGMTRSGRRSRRAAAAQLASLDADIIFTAHWAIPFYVSKMKKPHPYTVMFCPDVLSNGMFNVDCNLFLMPMKRGHDKVKRVRMYAGGNTAAVPFPIRKEAYLYEGRRDELREAYGIGKDDFTVLLCDGGYGMANLERTLKRLMKKKEKMTLIALCGTNAELYRRLSQVTPPENIRLIAVPFTDKPLEYVAMADLFVGKSGANSMAEPAFFGVPIIVTRCITYIERHIKNYYVRDLGGALFIPSPKRAAERIAHFAADPSALEKYRNAFQGFRNSCGAEAMADLLWESAGDAWDACDAGTRGMRATFLKESGAKNFLAKNK